MKYLKGTSDMPTIKTNVTVDIDLDNFDDYELVKELKSRGFTVYKSGDHDNNFIDKSEDRDYRTYHRLHDWNDDIHNLYKTYVTMSPEFFNKELKKYFRDKLYLNLY